MGTFRYVVRDAFRITGRHWGVSLLTLLTATALFLLVGCSAVFSLSVRSLARRVESDLVVQAFCASEADAAAVSERMSSVPAVVSRQVVSPDEGLARLKEKLGAQSQAIAMAGANPLPWAVELRVARAGLVPDVVRSLSQMSEVTDFIYAGGLADRLSRLSYMTTRVGVAIVALASLICALVFYNTVRIAIDSRRREIAAMLLVGATRTYAVAPFVIQGMMLGVGGSLLASGALFAGYGSAVAYINEVLPFLGLVPDYSGLRSVVLLLVSGGLALGWLCSLLVADRFVRRAAKPL